MLINTKNLMMKSYITGFLSLAIGFYAGAQTNVEKYAATITAADLKSQLTIVAGPAMEGRETATEGQQKAAAYIASQFQQFGLKPAPGTSNYQQLYPLYYDTVTNASLTINGKAYKFGEDFLSLAQNNETKNLKGKQVIFVGYGISDSTYDDYKGKNVKGKVVIMFAGEPRRDSISLITNTTRASKWTFPGLSVKAAAAASKGAVAVIIVNPNAPGIRPETVTRRTNITYPRAAAGKTVNTFSVSQAVASELLTQNVFDGLLAKAKAGAQLQDENVKVKKKVLYNFAEQRFAKSSSNVVGYIEGTDKKDEYVILTAHYDHLGKRGNVIFNGADDDGSGTVSVIEMAEAFAKAKAEGNGPRRTMVFMTVSGEEKGLWGSEYYGDNPLFPLAKTSVNLNTDMVGRIDPTRKEGDSTNYVYIIGDDKISTDLAKVTDQVNEKYVKLELDRRFNANDPNRYYYRSDHYNFAKKGVPIIFYFNGTHADYHRATDTIDKINFDVMTKRVHLVFHTAWEMANRNEMMVRDIPLK
ncbi:MAG: peptidase [Segetibacter sp.]|nr:peptidase [Segetibacter sp.]